MNLNKRIMKRNALRIVELADAFGHLPYNDHGQTVEGTLNYSIPCARLVKAEIVTAVADDSDGLNDNAVADVERNCSLAVTYTVANGGDLEYLERAKAFKLDLDGAADEMVLTALWWAGRSTGTGRDHQ